MFVLWSYEMNDLAVGFTVTIGGNKLELVKSYTTWSVYLNDDNEIYEGSYKRALQVLINRIG